MKTTFIFGIHPVIEALKAGKEFEKVFIQAGLNSPRLAELRKLLKDYGLSPRTVPAEKLKRFTTKAHQGVVAIVSPITYQNIDMIIPYIFEKGEQPLLLVVDRVSDVRNFGSIARTANCAGVHAIIFPEKESAMLNADAVKTSAGALNSIALHRSNNLKNTLKFLQNSGIQLIACTEKANENYTNVDYNLPTAIIVGSESEGISNDILRFADKLVKIPMKGEIGSLNVSVATAIVTYEAVRQRELMNKI